VRKIFLLELKVVYIREGNIASKEQIRNKGPLQRGFKNTLRSLPISYYFKNYYPIGAKYNRFNNLTPKSQ